MGGESGVCNIHPLCLVVLLLNPEDVIVEVVL
jgi:hypothetical protein